MDTYSLSGTEIPAKDRIRNLTTTAESIFVDMHSKPTKYFISGEQLYRTARYELSQGNLEKSYILLVRFLTLFIEKLPKHPQYKSVDEQNVKKIRSYCKDAIKLAEEVKTKIQAEYEREDGERKAQLQFVLSQRNDSYPADSSNGTDFDAVVDHIADINRDTQPSAPPIPERQFYDWPQFHPSAGSPQEDSEERFKLSPAIAAAGHSPGVPSFDRTTKPVPAKRGSKLNLLREVIVSHDLVQRFIAASRENTEKRNVETCGNLWGIRKEGSYVVTHLLIPKQKGTDSYCEDLDEGSEVAQYAISRDLIQLGWIHTHPTQSAFLSSVDLHMQWGYQIMLPEAIAIVVAPSYDDVAFFRLTPVGMDYVGQCPYGTSFHSHDTMEQLFERLEDVKFDGPPVQCEDFR